MVEIFGELVAHLDNGATLSADLDRAPVSIDVTLRTGATTVEIDELLAHGPNATSRRVPIQNVSETTEIYADALALDEANSPVPRQRPSASTLPHRATEPSRALERGRRAVPGEPTEDP